MLQIMSNEFGTPPPQGGAPSESWVSIAHLTQHAIHRMGSAAALGRALGFTTGSRVLVWAQGKGRPNIENCIMLARLMGEDPVEVLRLAGHENAVEVFTSSPTVIAKNAAEAALVPYVAQFRGMIAALEAQLDQLEHGTRKKDEDKEH